MEESKNTLNSRVETVNRDLNRVLTRSCSRGEWEEGRGLGLRIVSDGPGENGDTESSRVTDQGLRTV